MYLAWLAWCYSPEPVDQGYLSLPFASSCPNSKCQSRLCLNKSPRTSCKGCKGRRRNSFCKKDGKASRL